MFPVFSFIHLGKTYHIVRTVTFPWRRAFGFKPKQPYILTDGNWCAINGVTEADLSWYIQRGSETERLS